MFFSGVEGFGGEGGAPHHTLGLFFSAPRKFSRVSERTREGVASSEFASAAAPSSAMPLPRRLFSVSARPPGAARSATASAPAPASPTPALSWMNLDGPPLPPPPVKLWARASLKTKFARGGRGRGQRLFVRRGRGEEGRGQEGEGAVYVRCPNTPPKLGALKVPSMHWVAIPPVSFDLPPNLGL